jgi:hypothetical protein
MANRNKPDVGLGCLFRRHFMPDQAGVWEVWLVAHPLDWTRMLAGLAKHAPRVGAGSNRSSRILIPIPHTGDPMNTQHVARSHAPADGASSPSAICAHPLLALFSLLLLSLLCGCEREFEHGSVPRSGVGDETIAVIMVDLPLMRVDGLLNERIRALGRETQTDWAPFGRMVATLSSNGVNRIAIPIQFGSSMIESMGVYLGGVIRAENEDLESALIAAGGGSPLGAAALMTAVTDTVGGWKFWGMGGGGIANPNRSRARRYEEAFQESGPAPIQVVVLVPSDDILGDIHPQPSFGGRGGRQQPSLPLYQPGVKPRVWRTTGAF